MKKYLSLLLTFCLVLSLWACADGSAPATDPATTPTQAPTTEPTAPPTEPSVPETTEPPVVEVIHDLPMTAISITEQTEITNGKDDKPVFEYTYQNIRLVLPDPEMGMAVNLDILNRIDATRADAAELMNDAVDANPQYPYTYSIIYEPMRVDNAILSLFGQQSIYSGGSVFHAGHGMTYDLTTGKTLTLADILASDVTADDICPLVIDALAGLPEDILLFDDYVSTVEDRFAVDFRADAGWHLSDDGLCFTFLPYEVAPNSAGFIHALIPYEKLTGILLDPWFPVEQITPNGTMEVMVFSQEDADGFEQFAELYLNREGGTYLLHATNLVYDVVIESGFWNTDGTVFTAEQTVFRASSFVASDALMIQTDIPDTMPQLRITYTDATGRVSVYLSNSGEDGTPLLLSY